VAIVDCQIGLASGRVTRRLCGGAINKGHRRSAGKGLRPRDRHAVTRRKSLVPLCGASRTAARRVRFFVSLARAHLNKSRVGRNEREEPCHYELKRSNEFKMESLILAQGKRWRRA
jgi:hypothetical protein